MLLSRAYLSPATSADFIPQNRVQLHIVKLPPNVDIFAHDTLKGHTNFLHHAGGGTVLNHAGPLNSIEPPTFKAELEDRLNGLSGIAATPILSTNIESDLRPFVFKVHVVQEAVSDDLTALGQDNPPAREIIGCCPINKVSAVLY